MAKIPQNISREHLLFAIDEIRESGIPSGAESTKYDLVQDGERFPPKLIVAVANRFANGEELDRAAFSGGLASTAFRLLKDRGFRIETKPDDFEAGYQELKRQFLASFPDFSSFEEDERYRSRERYYKDELIDLYSQNVRPYLKDGDWTRSGTEFVSLLKKRLVNNTNQPQNIVGWRYFEPLGKLNVAGLTDLGRAINSLVGTERSLDWRMKHFVQQLKKIAQVSDYPSPAVSRSLISFLLTLHNHKANLFIKTREITKVLRCFDPSFRWNKQGLTAGEVQDINELSLKVFERLMDDGWKPTDLVDVQGFYWVATAYKDVVRAAAKPKTNIKGSSGIREVMLAPLNQILYGPPGTGKTHFTVNKALQILEPDFLDRESGDRSALRRRYVELQKRGRIGTVTFHQSFSYEDFVEGLRASADESGQIKYEIEPGIFKRMCESASAKATIKVVGPTELGGRRIWKMSLGDTQGSDAYVYDDCISNCNILLGYGWGLDYSNARSRSDVERIHEESGIDTKSHSYSVTAINLFVNEMQMEDIVVISDGNLKFRAIGKITGDYTYLRDRDRDHYRQARDVSWLRVYSPSLPREQLMKKSFSQMTLYELKSSSIDMERLDGLLNQMDDGTRLFRSTGFHVGQVFGRGYTVREVTSDVLRLTKPNGANLSFDMEMLAELASLVRSGILTVEDIREKRAFEKANISQEKFIVNGYSNIIHPLVEQLATPSTGRDTEGGTVQDAWVLIIDEINRGNIANIFGELITLIEPSKREGASEATEVTLPYSKDPFSVPRNLYIIGTMNTADRSLVHIDTALRRRFNFEAMMPDSGVLSDNGIKDIEGVNIVRMLDVLNQRIELLFDREHMLGHSFFLPLAETPTIECLAGIFDRQVLPLLEEYFFEDWSRIRRVLGDDQKAEEATQFIVPVHTQASIQKILPSDIKDELMNRAFKRNPAALANPTAYRLIYDNRDS